MDVQPPAMPSVQPPAQPNTPPPAPQIPTPEKPKNKIFNKMTLSIGGGVIILILIIAGSYNYYTRSASERQNLTTSLSPSNSASTTASTAASSSASAQPSSTATTSAASTSSPTTNTSTVPARTTAASTPIATTTTPTPTTPTYNIKAVSDTSQLVSKSAGYCRALTPSDWTLSPAAQANAIDMQSADKSLYAGWIIMNVNQAMQPYYGDAYGDPETSARAIANVVLSAKFGDTGGVTSMSQRASVSGVTLYDYSSALTKGVISSKTWPVDASNYIESVYMAATTTSKWNTYQDIVMAAAGSIECTTQLRPTSGGSVSGGGSSGSSSSNTDGVGSSDYNSELGYEYVHSPSTGENYAVDYASQYNANGPDGAGYYRSTGSNSYEKLDSGWQY